MGKITAVSYIILILLILSICVMIAALGITGCAHERPSSYRNDGFVGSCHVHQESMQNVKISDEMPNDHA